MKKSDTIPTPRSPIDYRVRCAAGIRDANDPQAAVAFEVLCYGMPYSELTSVDVSAGGENMSGGSRIARRLEARGIDTSRFFGDIFATMPINDRWDDKGQGRTPEPGREYLPPVMGD